MDRRKFLQQTALTGAALALSRRTPAATGRRPNVLLFHLDQMRQPRWFPPAAKFPNLERLKARGVEFTRHFTSAVPCSPSRACLWTGLHMDQHQVMTNVMRGRQPSLDPAISTLGHLFRKAGYQTPYFGKWHLTLRRQAETQGELEPYGFDWIARQRQAYPFPGLETDPEYNRAAGAWLREPAHQAQPWFMVISLINPHDICTYPRLALPESEVPKLADKLPDNWNDDLQGKPRCQTEFQKAYEAVAGRIRLDDEKVWRQYLDDYHYLTLKNDLHLGQVLEALEQSGQADRTLVIFTSDHGDMAGSHRLRAKGPFIYVENTNLPLVISWPKQFPAGVRTDALCQNIDLFPTLARLVGVDPAAQYPYLPGRDLTPILKNPLGQAGSGHVLFSYTGNAALARADQDLKKAGVISPDHIRAIRERNWAYARYFAPGRPEQEFELYDLKNDPLEMHNLALDPGYQKRRKEMADKLKTAEASEMARKRYLSSIGK